MLSAGDRQVRIVGQALDVLALLLARPGELVSREEIRAVLWPHSHVDFDHSLDVVMSRVRSILGDDGVTDRYLETVPRRGYRFIAPVTEVDRGRPAASRVWVRRLGTYAAVVLLAAFIAILIARSRYEPIVQSGHVGRSPGSRR